MLMFIFFRPAIKSSSTIVSRLPESSLNMSIIRSPLLRAKRTNTSNGEAFSGLIRSLAWPPWILICQVQLKLGLFWITTSSSLWQSLSRAIPCRWSSSRALSWFRRIAFKSACTPLLKYGLFPMYSTWRVLFLFKPFAMIFASGSRIDVLVTSRCSSDSFASSATLKACAPSPDKLFQEKSSSFKV